VLSSGSEFILLLYVVQQLTCSSSALNELYADEFEKERFRLTARVLDLGTEDLGTALRSED